MIGEIANEFESITKFRLLDYLVDLRDFLQNDYSEVYNYYSGKSETINVEKLGRLTDLLSRSNDLTRTFQTFSGKLGNVGYWELQQYLQDLKDTLERISKLPKYCRTSKTCRGYKPYIQARVDIGGMKTIQDIAQQAGSVTESELIMNNDLQEQDYEIDKLSQIDLLVNNENSIVVTTIMDSPVGKRIYGRDINRKISFSDNDLAIVEYEENVEQKCDILLGLNKGDVPEYPNFGLTFRPQGMAHYNYAELISDIRENFAQNDLFDDVNVIDIISDTADGTISVYCEIRTKYVYSTTKDVKL